MKQLLITIAVLVLVGCGESQQSATTPEAKPIARVAGAKAPDISIEEAAMDGDIEAVKQHLAADVDVNAKDRMGWTPLCEAVINGHKEIVELLIANSADVNAKHKTKFHFTKNQTTLYINNPTPLDWANISKQTEIADLLRKRGGKKSEVFEAEGN